MILRARQGQSSLEPLPVSLFFSFFFLSVFGLTPWALGPDFYLHPLFLLITPLAYLIFSFN
jgi:hypothetical protein